MRRRIVSHLVVLVVGMVVAAAALQVLSTSWDPDRAAGTGQQAGRWSGPQPLGKQTGQKSYGIYVGRDYTGDGSVLLGGSGDEVSSHWLEIVPGKDHPLGETMSVGVTGEAAIPGELTRIPQVRRTHKYISVEYSEFEGFPPPLTNGGLNEDQVAIRDIWSPSRDELVDMTPSPQRGPQYSDLARIGLQRATSARHAVQIMGELIDKYGHSTYGGNSHLIADASEGWVMLQFAGGKGLWVAERLGADDIRMSYPGYIKQIPTNCQEHPDFACSANFVDFAAQQGWWQPSTPFDVNEVYGEKDWDYRATPGEGKYVAPATIEQELARLAPVTLEEFMATVRDPRLSSDRTGYGQAAQLRRGVDRDLRRLWVSPTAAATSPLIPYFIGVSDEPPEYRQHRYLTKDAGNTFLNPEYAPQEGTEFAGRLFKRLMYHTCTHPEQFYPEVREALHAFEQRMRAEQATVEDTARTLINASRRDLAHRYLTEYSHTQAAEAMDLGRALVSSIEARAKLRHGVPHPPESESINGGSSEFGNYVTCHQPR